MLIDIEMINNSSSEKDLSSFRVVEPHIVDRASEFARERMGGIQSSHGWDHVQRVVNTAKAIAATEKKADLFIVRISAFLHDIARSVEIESEGAVCHAEEGSKAAYEFLTSQGLDPLRSRHIADCILTHRYRNRRPPASIEAKILYDADKLDSIGATGIGRAFLFAGEVGARLHNSDIDIANTFSYSREDTAYREFMFKLRKVKDSMLTSEGGRLAQARHDFMEHFFRQLDTEIHGNL